MLAGISADPLLGPLVACGAGEPPSRCSATWPSAWPPSPTAKRRAWSARCQRSRCSTDIGGSQGGRAGARGRAAPARRARRRPSRGGRARLQSGRGRRARRDGGRRPRARRAGTAGPPWPALGAEPPSVVSTDGSDGRPGCPRAADTRTLAACELRTGIALIAYDGSDDAAAAIRHAGSLLGPRPAVVAHVWDSLAALLLHTDVRGLTGSMREAADELDEEDRRDAERVAAEGAELAREAGFDAEAHALQGKPKAWPTLLAKADAIDAAVVVIGSRGQGAGMSALLGSVSSGLLHHTDDRFSWCPRRRRDARRACADRLRRLGRLPRRRHRSRPPAGRARGRHRDGLDPYSGVAAGGVIGAPVAVASRAVTSSTRHWPPTPRKLHTTAHGSPPRPGSRRAPRRRRPLGRCGAACETAREHTARRSSSSAHADAGRSPRRSSEASLRPGP